MKNTGELIAPALEPYKFFNQEFCSFNQLVKIGENVAEKNRELFTENLSLRSEIERLKKENELLKANQKAALLKQFNEDEQEEFKDRSIKELQLLLDYKGKHLKKGILRSQPTDASDKRTSTRMTPGSIGSWDPIKREWK